MSRAMRTTGGLTCVRARGGGAGRVFAALAGGVCLLLSLGVGGCSYQRDESAVMLAERGEFGAARARVAQGASDDPENRNFILDQMKVVSMGLADGVPDAIEPTADRLYDRLRTQGLNDDNRFASILLTEGAVRIYKGDPFEQALALANIAVLDGLKGDWGNMRAASQQSLFLLRDFSKALHETGATASSSRASSSKAGGGRRGARKSQEQSDQQVDGEQTKLVRAAAVAEQQGKSGDALGVDYTAVASDFELGYLLKAIAARKLGEREDMDEALKTLVEIAPRLKDVAGLVASGAYNTVFVVDYGLAPEKYGTGPDNAIASRMAVTQSDQTPLRISAGSSSSEWPVATDMNRIATSTKWANLEDVRVAKSTIGSVLIAGGLITAATADRDDDGQRLVGLIVAGVGALMKATSGADIRHNELFPQRSYVALADLAEGGNRVELSIGTRRLVLVNVQGGAAGGLSLEYVRMPGRDEGWATSETLRYSGEGMGRVTSECYPYILGGRDVRPPSLEALQDYQASGYLGGLTVDDLRELYREEEVRIAGVDGAVDQVGLHILEGGSWLYTPRAGSVGYKRLFYGEHPPFKAKSARARELAQEIARQREAKAEAERLAAPSGSVMERQSTEGGQVGGRSLRPGR